MHSPWLAPLPGLPELFIFKDSHIFCRPGSLGSCCAGTDCGVAENWGNNKQCFTLSSVIMPYRGSGTAFTGVIKFRSDLRKTLHQFTSKSGSFCQKNLNRGTEILRKRGPAPFLSAGRVWMCHKHFSCSLTPPWAHFISTGTEELFLCLTLL